MSSILIDPDDAASVDALCKALVEEMHAAGDWMSAANGVHPTTMKAALLGFVSPSPRPEAPAISVRVVADWDEDE